MKNHYFAELTHTEAVHDEADVPEVAESWEQMKSTCLVMLTSLETRNKTVLQEPQQQEQNGKKGQLRQ